MNLSSLLFCPFIIASFLLPNPENPWDNKILVTLEKETEITIASTSVDGPHRHSPLCLAYPKEEIPFNFEIGELKLKLKQVKVKGEPAFSLNFSQDSDNVIYSLPGNKYPLGNSGHKYLPHQLGVKITLLFYALEKDKDGFPKIVGFFDPDKKERVDNFVVKEVCQTKGDNLFPASPDWIISWQKAKNDFVFPASGVGIEILDVNLTLNCPHKNGYCEIHCLHFTPIQSKNVFTLREKRQKKHNH